MNTTSPPSPTAAALNRLLVAVVQDQDVEIATRTLKKLDLKVIRLPSTGGFLGRRNATLLIPLTESQQPAAMQALGKSCRTRVEYVTLPLEGAALPIPPPTPIYVGGAKVFILEIDHFETF